MTVKELIELLEKENPNAIVCTKSDHDVFTFPVNFIKRDVDEFYNEIKEIIVLK